LLKLRKRPERRLQAVPAPRFLRANQHTCSSGAGTDCRRGGSTTHAPLRAHALPCSAALRCRASRGFPPNGSFDTGRMFMVSGVSISNRATAQVRARFPAATAELRDREPATRVDKSSANHRAERWLPGPERREVS
jgi:hypothetical protein